MTLNEWYEFNKSVLAFGGYAVKVYRKRTFASCDIEINTLIDIDAAAKFFGNYEVNRIKIATDYAFPKCEIMLWPVDKKEEE